MTDHLPHRTMALVVAALLLAGCDGGSPDRPTTSGQSTRPSQPDAACESVVQSMIDATQKYVDALESPAGANSTPDTTAADYQQALESATATLTRLDCDPEQTQRSLDAKWARLHAEGPVARAVLAQLKYTLTKPVSSFPTTAPVVVGERLDDALARLPEGSTIQLAKGTYRVNQTLVVLRGITIRGAGRGDTVIDTSAADNGMLILTAAPVAMSELTIRHSGSAPANLVSAGPEAALSLTDVAVSGAVAGRDGGGTGVLLSASADAGPATTRTTTLTVRSSEFADNDRGGVVVAGRHRASITGSTFLRNGQCGVCFLGSSDGWVRTNVFRDNETGVAAAASARPLIRRNTFSGGQVGIQVGDRAAPEVTGNTVTAPERAAMIYTDDAAGTVDGNTCSNDKPGIVIVGETPYPYLKQNDCRVATTG